MAPPQYASLSLKFFNIALNLSKTVGLMRSAKLFDCGLCAKITVHVIPI